MKEKGWVIDMVVPSSLWDYCIREGDTSAKRMRSGERRPRSEQKREEGERAGAIKSVKEWTELRERRKRERAGGGA